MSLYAMKPFSDNQTHKVGDSATLLPIKESELKWPAQTGVADPPHAIADNDRKGNFLSLFSVFLPTCGGKRVRLSHMVVLLMSRG